MIIDSYTQIFFLHRFELTVSPAKLDYRDDAAVHLEMQSRVAGGDAAVGVR